MDWILFIIFVISFIIVYQINKTSYYIYSILFPYVGYFILNKAGYGLAYTVLNAQYIAIIALAIFMGLFNKQSKSLFLYIGVFILFFVTLSFAQDVPYLKRLNDYKAPFIFLLWGGLLFEDIKYRRVSVPRLKHFFVGFLVFEIILCSLQYMFEPIRDFFRNVNYVGIDGGIQEIGDVLKSGYMVGTFRGGSTLANVLAISFMTCAIYYFSNNRLTTQSLLLLLGIEIIILLTGIRAALFLTFVFIVVLMFIYRQRRAITIPIIIALIIMATGSVTFGYLEDFRSVNFEAGGLARSLTLFNVFSGNTLQEQSTFAMTVNMIPYVLQNPLFGIGLHYNGGYTLAQWGMRLEDFSITDAMLSFEIAEIGIVGLLIYLWPLWYYMKKSQEIGANRKRYLCLFLFMIMATVVDSGIMTSHLLMLFFFSVIFMINEKETNNIIQTILMRKRHARH